MAVLLALVYSDEATAEKAAQTAKNLQDQDYLNVLDSAVILKNADGKVEQSDKHHPVRRGAVLGAAAGGLFGLFFAVPALGAAAGAALGGWAGTRDSSGGKGDFATFAANVGNELEPGGAAFVLLGEAPAYDRAVAEFGQLGGKLISSDVSEEEVARAQAQLDKYLKSSSEDSN